MPNAKRTCQSKGSSYTAPGQPYSTAPSPVSRATPSTPRKRKPARVTRNAKDGLRETKLTVKDVKETVKRELKLDFDIEDWQAHTIHKVLSGFDNVCIAGTSYGKSILFEGLAAMNKKKVIIVVCPLKILEKDQVDQAEAKGLRAIYINEDNSKDHEVWKKVHSGYYSLVYVSPEMLLSPRFRSLLLDESFRKKLQAIAVDEMHLVKEWGDDFRVKYKELHRLRVYTGNDIPFFGCTATATTEVFNTVWDDLQFGCRPFWGIDVGIERPNLQFIVRRIVNEDNPILDVLNILPEVINDTTQRNEIKKSIIFLKTRDDCCRAVHTFRQCLPESLRDSIQGFYSSLTEEAKDLRWERFCNDEIRVIVSTVAASIGCNDRKIEVVINGELPGSLSAVNQRWGRGGRDASKEAICMQLAPKWAFRPEIQSVNPALARITGASKKASTGSKQDAVRREKLDKDLEELVNLNNPSYPHEHQCIHAYMRAKFRPDTQLDIYESLDATTPSRRGSRSLNSPLKHPLSWVVLDLKKAPCPEKCCNGANCNPSLSDVLMPCSKDDPRLHAYKDDFIQLKIDRDAAAFDANLCRDSNTSNDQPPERPASAMSTTSTASGSTTTSKRGRGTTLVEKERLAEMLVEWRKTVCAELDSDFVTPDMILSDAHVRRLMQKSYIFLSEGNLTRAQLTSVVKLDLFTHDNFVGLLSILRRWQQEIRLQDTPSKTQGRAKKTRIQSPKKSHPGPPPAASLNNDNPTASNSIHNDDPFTFTPSYRDRATVRDVSQVREMREKEKLGLSPDGLSNRTSPRKALNNVSANTPLVLPDNSRVNFIPAPNQHHIYSPSSPQPPPLHIWSQPARTPHPLSQSVTPANFYNASPATYSPAPPLRFPPPPIYTGYPQHGYLSPYASASPVSPYSMPGSSRSVPNPTQAPQPMQLLQYSMPLTPISPVVSTGPMQHAQNASTHIAHTNLQWIPTNSVSKPRQTQKR